MVRTIADILKEADKAEKLSHLIDLWNEVANNKYKYSLVDIRFAREHIMELSLKVDGEDITKGHFYISLDQQTKQKNYECCGILQRTRNGL